MPTEQSGPNATVEIFGTVNDVQGSQHIHVHGNETLKNSLVSKTELENLLKDIRKAADLLPEDIPVAREIMDDIATILSLLQKHSNGKDDLEDPVRSCTAICSTLVLATKGASTDQMSNPYWNALDALQSSITDLKSSVQQAAKPSLRRIIQRILGYDAHLEEINAWNTKLCRIFTSFSARLNIIPMSSLERICKVLPQQVNVTNVNPDPTPLSPILFFGREELLRKVKDVLLRGDHVALIGPGGIGKSTLAIALMNEEDIIKHFRRRFFVTYANMNSQTITFGSFMDRIASVLGLSMSGAEGEPQIKTNLRLSSVLLILDNVETFEAAADQDEVAQISDFIARIANIRGVTVLMTSRTSSETRRVSYIQFDVLPFAREPARQSFRRIYGGEISNDEIDELLAAVDFHPLSISILASTAKENDWPAKTLLEKWNLQQSKLSDTRGASRDSLRVTIKLCLESPSIEALGDNTVRVLHVIAFFPQGINQDHLARLFPSLYYQISSIVDTLCRLSLITRSSPFLTILPPIRLALLGVSPAAGLELLRDIRRVYYSSMRAITEKNDSHADLIVSDHFNIEHLIAFDIAHPPFDIQDIRRVSCGFLGGLERLKPRTTLLLPVISSLPEVSESEKDSKAWCLEALGSLYHKHSRSSAEKLELDARKLFASVGNHSMASFCTSNVASSYNSRGRFSQAQQLLDDFKDSSSWHGIDQDNQGEIDYTLDVSRMHTSPGNANDLFVLSKGEDNHFRDQESDVIHWQARMRYGYSRPEEVQKRLEPLRSKLSSLPDMCSRWKLLGAMAEAAFLQRRFDVAMDQLNLAYQYVDGNFALSAEVLICQAAVASEQGKYDLSLNLAMRCLDVLGVVPTQTSSSNSVLRALYVRGRNELYARNYSQACRLLAVAAKDCDTLGDLYTKTLCERALGEAQLSLGHRSDSDNHFAETMNLCRESGTPPELFGACTPMLKLDDEKFSGWKRYREKRGHENPRARDKRPVEDEPEDGARRRKRGRGGE